MPRKPRFILPGVPQHDIQRGNNREPCFFAEQDYARYKEDLKISRANPVWLATSMYQYLLVV